MGSPFRLAGLLRFRQAQEEQAAAALAQANVRHKEQVARVNEVRGTLAAAPTDPGSAAALRASAAARSAARSMLLELHALSVSTAADAATAQEKLMAAKKSAASLEKLEEKHDADRHLVLLRDEQVFLDELAATRATGPGHDGQGLLKRGNE